MESLRNGLQARLTNGSGLILWEETLYSDDERTDLNWRNFEMAWVVPFLCVIFAPNGSVKAMIDLPQGTPFRPLDPERPDAQPEISGIDVTPYKRAPEPVGQDRRT